MSALDEAVERVRRGDADAFAVVVESTQARLYRLAARLIGDRAEAEDVLQDAYVRAYDAIVSGSFDRRARLETWLYRIVANAALDALRARRRARARERTATEGAAATSTTDVEGRDALRRLERLLTVLPPEQRAALVLKELEGLSIREIAHALRCSEGAVEQRLVRARTTLRSKRDE